MKRTLTSFAVIIALLAQAEPVAGSSSAKVLQMTPEQRALRIQHHRAAVYRATGGFLVKPGSQAGKIRIVTAVSNVAPPAVEAHLASLRRMGKYDLAVVQGEPVDFGNAASAKKSLGAAFAVFITDAAFEEPLLAAPDGGWAIVNARACGSSERAAKEAVRALAFIAGAATSSYGVTVMSVRKPAELDIVKEIEFPQDVLDRMNKHLATCGVRPEFKTSYKNACQEGWAPQPTNDIQRAIWDKVHQLPTKPLKVEFDPKTDK